MIISKLSASETKNLADCCNDPTEAYTRMMSDLKATELYLNKIINRNMYIKLIEGGLGTEEVGNLADRIVGKQKNKRAREVGRIMNFRLNSIKEEVRELKHESFNRTKAVKEVLKNPAHRRRFFNIKKEFKTYVWHLINPKKNKKVRFLRQKNRQKQISREREVNGEERFYKVTDAELSKMAHVREDNFIICGEVSLSEEEKQCLTLGPKYMIKPEMKREDMEVELEIECIKTRMELIKRDETDPEDEEEPQGTASDAEQTFKQSTTIYDAEEKTLDMSRLLVTDAKYNTRSYPPRRIEPEHEVKIQSRKQQLIEIFEDQKTKVCDSGKNTQKNTNLSRKQQSGIKMLKQRASRGEIVITLTDKSGKFAVVERELYRRAAQVHMKDREIELKEISETETLLNRHAIQMIKALKMGTRHGKDGQVDRISQAFTSHGGRPGPVSFLVKDHKKMAERENMYPTRMLCVAKGGIGARFSNLITTILNKASDAMEASTECTSTEDAKRCILETNRRNRDKSVNNVEYPKVIKEMRVLSMDVKALYPSLRIDAAKRIVKNLILRVQEEERMTFHNIEWKEVGKYLAIMMTVEEQEEEGLTAVIPTRNVECNARGRKPGPAYWESDKIERVQQNGTKVKVNKWIEGNEPEEDQKRRMLAEMMAKAVETSMRNHLYRFDGKNYKQEDGGPIGDELSQAVARMVMMWWDERFIELCTKIGMKIEMCTRYVDDVNIAVIPQPPGSRFIEGKISFVPEFVEQDTEKGVDIYTGELLTSIANSISEMLEFEVDHCSNHVDGKMPILDLKVWTEEIDGFTQIRHTFYKKPMASNLTLRNGTAYPKNRMRAVMVEEALRRLRNCSPELPKEEKGKHMTDFALGLKMSGHDERFRMDIIKGAMKIYEDELRNHNEGKKDIYRSRATRNEQLRLRGGKASKDNWYKKKKDSSEKNGTTSILRVPYTGGTLAKAMSNCIKEGAAPKGTKTIVQEDTGIKLAHQIVKQDPFPLSTCSREKCNTVVSGKESCHSTCYQANVNYKITCDECESDRKEGKSPIERVYYGESSRGCFERYKSHVAQYRAKKTGFMIKHDQEFHGGRGECKFTIQRTDVDRDPLRRMVRESIRIRNAENDPNIDLLNTKEEWFGVQTIGARFSQEW